MLPSRKASGLSAWMASMVCCTEPPWRTVLAISQRVSRLLVVYSAGAVTAGVAPSTGAVSAGGANFEGSIRTL
ncbi:hypothetical protein D3C85_1308030 [compost metagenome]